MAGAMAIESGLVADSGGAAESATVTVNAPGPPVGVPPIAPLEAFSVKPAGSAPAVTLQVYGGMPPVAAMVAL